MGKWAMRTGYLAAMVNPNRSTLKWAEIGPIFETLLEMGAFTGSDFRYARPIEDIFRDLSTVTMPAFTEQASKLLAILDYKINQLAYMRQKMLAAVMSVMIASSQLL